MCFDIDWADLRDDKVQRSSEVGEEGGRDELRDKPCYADHRQILVETLTRLATGLTRRD